MYNLLISKESSDTLLQSIYNKWTEDLGVDVKETWKAILSVTYKLTTNENKLKQLNQIIKHFPNGTHVYTIQQSSSTGGPGPLGGP